MNGGLLGYELEDWWPMTPAMGPPLPRFLEVYWPWFAAEFRVSNLFISPTEVNPGQVVTISCTAANIGTEAGSYTVKLGGDFMAEQAITLEPGESKAISFEVVPDVAKTYSISVNGLTGTFRATEAPVADIRVENLTITPAEVNVGELVTISVTATNYGAVSGSKTIICTVT